MELFEYKKLERSLSYEDQCLFWGLYEKWSPIFTKILDRKVRDKKQAFKWICKMDYYYPYCFD